MLLYFRLKSAATKYGRRFVFRCGHRTLTLLLARTVAWGKYQPRRIRWKPQKAGWVLYVDLTGVIHLRAEWQREQRIRRAGTRPRRLPASP